MTTTVINLEKESDYEKLAIISDLIRGKKYNVTLSLYDLTHNRQDHNTRYGASVSIEVGGTCSITISGDDRYTNGKISDEISTRYDDKATIVSMIDTITDTITIEIYGEDFITMIVLREVH